MKKSTAFIVIAVLLVGLLLPTLFGCSSCEHAFSDWSTVRDEADALVRSRTCQKCKGTETLTLLKTVVDIGLTEEVRLIHVTDTHWCLSDERDSRKSQKASQKREKRFDYDISGQNMDLWTETARYTKGNDLFMLHTGDMVDNCSAAAYDFLDTAFSGIDHLIAAGNHDFGRLGVSGDENSEFKAESLALLAPHVKNDLIFDSVIIGGVNIIALDDSYYKINEAQVAAIKAEAEKGLPIVLCMHVPIFTESYADRMLADEDSAYLLGATEEYLNKYSESRRLQQAPDKTTLDAITYILSEPLIKAVVTGHTHMNFEGTLQNGIPQYSTNGVFDGYARLITLR